MMGATSTKLCFGQLAEHQRLALNFKPIAYGFMGLKGLWRKQPFSYYLATT